MHYCIVFLLASCFLMLVDNAMCPFLNKILLPHLVLTYGTQYPVILCPAVVSFGAVELYAILPDVIFKKDTVFIYYFKYD